LYKDATKMNNNDVFLELKTRMMKAAQMSQHLYGNVEFVESGQSDILRSRGIWLLESD